MGIGCCEWDATNLHFGQGDRKGRKLVPAEGLIIPGVKHMLEAAIELADNVAQCRSAQRSAEGLHRLRRTTVDLRIVQVGQRGPTHRASQRRQVQ